MKNKTILVIVVILIDLAGVIGGWFVFSSQSSTKSTQSNSTQSSSSNNLDAITSQQLAENNGQNGKPCWVAVDGTVYEISGFAQWVDGIHTPSGGKARCGKDLSAVINESPHGKSKLKLLTEIGQLEK